MIKFSQIDFRFIFLAAMLIFLPGVEALKNIFAFLFVLSWAFFANKENFWGGKWGLIDTIFLLWLLADAAVSINAIITHQLPGSGFRDVFRYVLIAWIISRTYFTKVKMYLLALIAIIATVITLGYSYYSTGGVLKELHSVGHINHTAIFLLMIYSITLPLLLFDFHKFALYQRAILIISSIVLFLSTIDTGSRASFGILIIVTLLNFFFFVKREKNISLIFIFFTLVLTIGLYFTYNPPDALKRIQASENIFEDSMRSRINNFSYYAFKTNPYLGVGFGNYSRITKSDIEEEVIKELGFFESNNYFESAHAHNVYFNYLVSGGLLIFSVFLCFWFFIVWIISKLIFTKKANDWIVISSVSTLMINLGIGWFNTTLHHEHAILSMFILGILISEFRQTQKINNF